MYKQLLVVPIFILLVIPFVSFAQIGGGGGGPHPVCVAWVAQCKKGKCPPPPPCTIQQCTGICTMTTLCKAEGSCIQGDGSSDASGAGGAEQMMQMAQKLMEQLSKGGGGGGSPPGGGSPSGEQQQAPSTVNDILNGLYNSDPIKVGSAVDQITDLLEGAASSSGTSTATIESVAQILTTIASTPVGTSTAASVEQQGGITSNPIESVGAATRSLINRIFSGRTENTEGETVNTGTVQGETGIGAFFGRLFGSSSANEAPQFFTRLCTNRPWQASIISSIFSPAFFDTLCVRNGVVSSPAGAQEEVSATNSKKATLACTTRVQKGNEATLTWNCEGATHSGAVGFNTNGQVNGTLKIVPTETKTYELQCNTGSRASCVITVGEPRADIEVSPFSVDLGGRARLYWTSEGVESCTITGAGMQETGLSGAATTPAIYDTTEFIISCTSSTGEIVTDAVVLDVGL